MRYLRDEFFRPLFGEVSAHRVACLAMTATMSTDLLRDLSSLTCVDWSQPRHQMWATASEFRHRDVKMEVFPSGDVTQGVLKAVVDLLASDADAHVCIFVNFKSEAAKWTTTLEKLLADKLLKVGVLAINGDMDKNEKFAFIRLFTSRVHLRGYSPRCLVATSAANTGIDQPKCKMVLRIGVPRSIVEAMQERGRIRHRGVFAVHSDWTMLVTLVLSVLKPKQQSSNR